MFDNNMASACNEVNVLCRHLHELWVVDDEECRGVRGELNLTSCREMVSRPPIYIVALNQLLHIPEDTKLCLGLETCQIVW